MLSRRTLFRESLFRSYSLRAMLTLLQLPGAVMCLSNAVCHAQGVAVAGPIVAENCLVSARETIDVPALERGALATTLATPGMLVQEGQLLATLDDVEARLTLQLSEQELRVAEQKLKATRAVEIAEAGVAEAEQLLNQAGRDAEAARLVAEDDSALRLAEKLEQLASSDLELARSRRAVSRNSYSEQELLKLQNQHEQSMIRVQSGGRERTLAALRQESKQAEVEQQRSRLQQLKMQRESSRETVEAERLELQSLQISIELAKTRLQKRKLAAPFPGVIIEQTKFVGEWLEPGQAVYRLMRLDRLTVEGFVSPEAAAGLSAGQPVLFERGAGRAEPVRGNLVFISPAIDALNKAVRVRAEVTGGPALRPGEVVKMRKVLTDGQEASSLSPPGSENGTPKQ
ncbi:MAG: HlyD family efflux transporter periplasmic adaptor subunit [Planctomycetia bacterium]